MTWNDTAKFERKATFLTKEENSLRRSHPFKLGIQEIRIETTKRENSLGTHLFGPLIR